MAHFGVICPPITGHVNPLAAVGRALIDRGHEVTLIHVQDMEAKARTEGLRFAALGIEDYPSGTLAQSVLTLGTLTGWASLKYSVKCACDITNLILRDGPEVIRQQGIDGLLIDQNEPSGGSVAEHLGIPFLSACTSLPLNREPLIPPPFVGWPFVDSQLAKLRNRIGYSIADYLISPIQEVLNNYRKNWGLRKIGSPDDTFSRIASIAQMPREFDFPRERLPETFRYLGPWFDDRSSSGVPFPFEKLDGRPVVYGSIGTLQDRNSRYFEIMAQACSELDVQLILALGHETCEAPNMYPGKPIVVNYAPQLELLARTAVTITHAGMNTTQQSLYFGVPVIAIPLAHDQPAIAARLARTGAGIVIPPARLTPLKLCSALQELLAKESQFRSCAGRLREACLNSGGVQIAADIAERLL